MTHFHPDHVSGVPLMLMDMWLLGRRRPMQIHGLRHTVERIELLMNFYGWTSWPNFFPVAFETLPERELSKVVEGEGFRVLSSPVRHLIPTVGLRIECSVTNKVIAYSCDTEPSEEVARLAAGADILIHEAAGRGRGHSSAEQAGEVARQAEVGRLATDPLPHVSRRSVAARSGRARDVSWGRGACPGLHGAGSRVGERLPRPGGGTN